MSDYMPKSASKTFLRSSQQDLTTETEPIQVFVRCKPFSASEQDRFDRRLDMRVGENCLVVCPPTEDDLEELANSQQDTIPATPKTPGRVFKTPSRIQTTTTSRAPFSRKKLDTEVKSYTFDRVFDLNASQQDLYDAVAPSVETIFEGRNATVFAYGQTGSGKTHSLFGSGDFEDPENPYRGIIPRAVSHIFDIVSQSKEQYVVMVTFVELYGDRLIDLLEQTGNEPSKISIVDHKDGSVVLNGSNFLRQIASSCKGAMSLIAAGVKRRQTGPTNLNSSSSRSHAILMLELEKQSPLAGTKIVTKLNVVDLAGSERLKKSGAQGAAQKETQDINMSLTHLRSVLTSLAKGEKHIPYRNSKLTKVLRDSLGGYCKTLFIVNIHTTKLNWTETQQSLTYGSIAHAVENKVAAELEVPIIAPMSNAVDLEAKQFRAENFLLRQNLESALKKNADLEERILLLKAELQQSIDEKDQSEQSNLILQQRIMELERSMKAAAADSERVRDALTQQRQPLYDLSEQQTFNNLYSNNNNNNNNNNFNSTSTPLSGRTIQQQQQSIYEQTPDRLPLAERNFGFSSPRTNTNNMSASKKRGINQMMFSENQQQQQQTQTPFSLPNLNNTPSKKQKMIPNLEQNNNDTSSPMMNAFERDVPLHNTSVSSSASKHQKTKVVQGILANMEYKGRPMSGFSGKK